MLDLLYAAVNTGTGRRAALAIPTFGKTGTTQENRDAVFIGFAGNLVVGVWVGRDDNKSLGKISGGTVPAQIWRNFMTSALAVDRQRGPELPAEFRRRQRREPSERPREIQSPLPPGGATAPRTCGRSRKRWTRSWATLASSKTFSTIAAQILGCREREPGPTFALDQPDRET